MEERENVSNIQVKVFQFYVPETLLSLFGSVLVLNIASLFLMASPSTPLPKSG